MLRKLLTFPPATAVGLALVFLGATLALGLFGLAGLLAGDRVAAVLIAAAVRV